jgi:two-component system, chemotaxis family, chemotaxis protein CheY
MKLLTVDDSAMMRKIIADAAAVTGFDVLEAENGDRALALLKAEAKDIAIILLDWNMPGMNGLELLRKIKSDKKTAKIPVMMVTTESERANVVQAIQAGAANYLAKPFAQEDLITKIMQTIGAGS